MLTKILITLLIIVGAVVFLRHQKTLKQNTFDDGNTRTITYQPEPSTSHSTMKWIAFGVLSLTLLTGSIMLFLNWQDEHRLFEIKIVNPQTGGTDTYQAYKKDLRGRTFTTITGQQITVSELERLEFQEVE